ncbi:hypothetical protein [Halomonas sp.]|uniref:hypothetical protein n=1 Tax=Halomonas sp. TaxID=1486246 RepID=UPI003A94770E
MQNKEYVLDDQYEVITIPHEMRMSLWVYSPVVVECATQKRVLDLSGSLWDLRRVAEDRGRVSMVLARYPEGNREYVVKVDPVGTTAIVEGIAHPLADIETALNAIT